MIFRTSSIEVHVPPEGVSALEVNRATFRVELYVHGRSSPYARAFDDEGELDEWLEGEGRPFLLVAASGLTIGDLIEEEAFEYAIPGELDEEPTAIGFEQNRLRLEVKRSEAVVVRTMIDGTLEQVRDALGADGVMWSWRVID